MVNGEFAQSDVIEVASDLVPFQDDGKKDKYLTYRSVGFSKREAAEMADVHPKSVLRWYRDDPAMKELDNNGMSDMRDKVANKFLDAEFTRNFYLVMQQDFKVLRKAVLNEQMDNLDISYLMKLRQHYTPQALAMIKQLLTGGSVDKPFDFTDMVLTISRKRETVVDSIELKG